GEMEYGFCWRLVLLGNQRRVARPANFHAAEEIGLGAGHAVKPCRLELRALAEDVRVGMEARARAAPVVHVAEAFQRSLRHAARKALAVELPAARDLDLEHV